MRSISLQTRQFLAVVTTMLLLSAVALVAGERQGEPAAKPGRETGSVDTMGQSPQPITDDSPIKPVRLGITNGGKTRPKKPVAPQSSPSKKAPPKSSRKRR